MNHCVETLTVKIYLLSSGLELHERDHVDGA